MNLYSKIKIILSLILFVFIKAGFGQQISHLNNKEGLINGTINTFERDSLGYVWIGTDQGLNRYSGLQFKNYNLDKINLFKAKEIVEIINLHGDLYIISSSGSLFKYNYKTDHFKKIFIAKNKRFLSLTSLNKSHLLIGLSKGLIIYDLDSGKATETQYEEVILNREVKFFNNKIYSATSRGIFQFQYNKTDKQLTIEKSFLKNQDIISFSFDHQGRIWAGTEVGGLFIINGDTIKNIQLNKATEKTYAIRKINFDNNKNALIALDRLGLFVLNQNFEVVKKYSHEVDDANSISQNSIYEIFVDHANAYWLGFSEGGVNIISSRDNIFSNIKHVVNEKNSINNNNIRSIFETSNGDLWFGTENGVSKYFNNKWINYNQDPKLYNTAVLSVNKYNDKLILGTYGEGLLALNEKTRKVSNLSFEKKSDLKFIFHTAVFDNDLWIGGTDGPLSYYHKNTFINNYAVGLVRSLVKGYDEIIYVASRTGFYEINKRNSSVKKIKENIFNSFNEVYNLNFDHLNNCIWIGSKNGIYKYNLSTEDLESLGNTNIKEMGTVYSIEKDNRQNIYLACISGLWKYDIKKKIFRKYDDQDGLLVDEFGFGASAKLSDGSIAFGGPKGAVIFDPINIKEDRPISDIFISNFQINGKEPDSLTLPKSINYTKKLVLNYDQNSISFNFETIKFHGSKRNLFKWKLNGYDKDSLTIYGTEKITYSNLKPGDYSLVVNGYNADGIKSKNNYQIEILVKKPFWKTWWAFTFYFFVFCLIVFLVIKISRANTQNKVDENRIKFFVEVAHDIRTPVSLIQLLVKQLANQENVEKSIDLIQRNTQNLNEYVTQLLDFQKIDRKQLKLSISNVDLKDCLIKIINDFSPILQEKSLDIILEVKHIPVWFDVKKMNRIFYNLISNAIKYSNEGGEIKIKSFLSDKTLRIDFIDNGIGIPEKQLELVFKRFTRGTNVSNKGIPGTGIGLLLSKKIIELHGGKISLESKENIGSKFSIELPCGTEHYNSEDLVNEPIQAKETNTVGELIGSNKLILLVEDNNELREAVKKELDEDFNVITASNGKEGLLIALSKNPDLIITDVMMPEMDGKELCNLLKTNFKTSHIPVIMLTALADIDDKIRGLETGADAYVEKPFNVQVLKATMNNLIRSRENIKHLFDKKEVKKELTPDESFLSDVITTIIDNLLERDFSIDTLCKTMGLSRSNLFRKLKGLIQMSPSDLILKIKLSQAEELMKKKAHNRISDIAYSSGFQDPKYFSTLFKKHYGKTPKEFIEEL
jgi:CheY-like chemotaxis protein